MDKLRILHLEDDSNDAFFVRRALEKAGFDVEIVPASSRDDFVLALESGNLDAILVDQGLPGFSGSSALELARARRPKTPFIFVSGAADEQRIANSLKAGASGYVLKSQLWRLPSAIRRARLPAETAGAAPELEEKVRSLTSQLNAANREMEMFSYSVLHDLRAPLRTIGGYAQLLEDELHAIPDENLHSYLAAIKSETVRMSRMIGDLARLSKLIRIDLQVEPVDLSTLAGDLSVELQSRGGRPPVEFNIQKGVEARGDRTLLRGLLEQLLANAWKYTAKRPEAVIEFGAAPEPGGVVFFVRDNGVGFDPKYSDNLFAPFQKLHPEDEPTGTGVGLAEAKRIVDRHGGKIWVESAEGRGATFFFTLGGSK